VVAREGRGHDREEIADETGHADAAGDGEGVAGTRRRDEQHGDGGEHAPGQCRAGHDAECSEPAVVTVASRHRRLVPTSA
jgi:hypothetical protein